MKKKVDKFEKKMWKWQKMEWVGENLKKLKDLREPAKVFEKNV